MIQVDNLTKYYDDVGQDRFYAVNQISFRAEAGEIFALLGPNGAGKTTTLRILSTMLRPSAGKVSVAGYDVLTASSEVRRNIGLVSTGTAVYDRMTAWEMVEYFGRLHEIENVTLRERMEMLFERLQMNDIRGVLGSKMSTGMKQKVSIARAMVHDPPVLIFDEATSGLDVLASRALLDIVHSLRDQGKCVIFSTHIMREVEKLADRVAIMHRGRILAEGSLDEVHQRYNESDFEELFFQLISRHEYETDSIGDASDEEVQSTIGGSA